MRNVSIMSRSEAIRYCHKHHDNKSVMISISDPYMMYTSAPFSNRDNGIVDILRLCFADADGVGSHVWVPPEAEGGHNRLADENDLMTVDDAQRIARFLTRVPTADVIVHCDAGLSRSAGVAAAVLKHFSGDDSAVFDSGRYYPNMWCYRLTLDALDGGAER